ncbi:hypothetical protein XJ32_06460 [Helicobacter bilis]|uniref:Uncharacterized protein n=1 Tax=Helicobacter bilis TaxID=37372 RepID=A0A1Q2LHB5_9HELI|nr:hypothetical protein [Helicobacter bilis]AQQ59783.1 hypothetical protein XJ32_06460 [Helicobacter bilis]
MEQDKLEIEKQLLQIHYYFTDESHSMDAFVRNAMEKYLLNLMKEIANILDIKIKVENQARDEGGLIESLILHFDSIATTSIAIGVAIYLKESVNKIIIHYLTGAYKREKLENLLKKEQIKELQLKNNNDVLTELKKILQGFDRSPKIRRIVSNFYNKAEKYEKIEKIGYKTEKSSELLVKREQFKTFILTENKDIELIENAEIEIISPVLKEDEYKWKGIYNGNKIDFSMGDSSFKNDVITQKYNFINGTSIICDLEISRTFDEYGEEVKISYRVKKVVGTRLDEKIELTKFGLKRKRQKEKDLQPNLFNYQERSNND